jgi:hypothetical protein
MFSSIGGMGVSDLPKLKKWKTRQLSSSDPEGGNMDFVSVPAGKTVDLGEVKGSGWVSRVWFTLMCPDKDIYRKLILRFYWDGEENPSVEAPFGDFFGVGFSEYAQNTSLIQGVTSGGFYSYWPMPFTKGARFEARNIGDIDVSHLYFGIQIHETEVNEDIPRFHAKWKRENPTKIGENYTILEAKGQGHYCGVVLSMQAYDKGSRFMLEGDEMIWVDGEDEPSIKGTGTEDYFQGGWYWENGPFSAPFHGLTVGDKMNSKYSAYRLHIPDPSPFKDKIRVAIEHGNCNMLQEDYSSLAYWYQLEPHDTSFGNIPDDAGYVTPIGTREEAYLMSELIQDPPANVERRKVISEAARLRLQLRKAKAKGIIPPELKGLDDNDFLHADYEGLEMLVNKVMQRKLETK